MDDPMINGMITSAIAIAITFMILRIQCQAIRARLFKHELISMRNVFDNISHDMLVEVQIILIAKYHSLEHSALLDAGDADRLVNMLEKHYLANLRLKSFQ